ncbi:MAG: MBL fold metallo-hydrolase [Haliscomenobacter sp.]
MPVIGCPCEVCRSSDIRDNRLRAAALIQSEDTCIAIDCGPDFRQQMLRQKVEHLDAILLTHEHNDHVIGLDEVRPFNFRTKVDMPVYGSNRVLRELRQRFPYVFDEINRYPGAPRVVQKNIHAGQVFQVQDIEILPFEVMHGMMPVMAYRFDTFAYITDMRTISAIDFERLRGVEYLVVNALHHFPHHSHMNVEEALHFIERLRPRITYLTHSSHQIGLHASIEKILPPQVRMGYDGLQIKIE